MSILQQNRARSAAKRAFPLPQPCERCGKGIGIRHHEDYNKPLEIVWLCPSCHAVRHREMRNGKVRHWTTEAHRKQVLDFFDAGKSPSQIVDLTGISQSKVYEFLRWWRRSKQEAEQNAKANPTPDQAGDA